MNPEDVQASDSTAVTPVVRLPPDDPEPLQVTGPTCAEPESFWYERVCPVAPAPQETAVRNPEEAGVASVIRSATSVVDAVVPVGSRAGARLR